MPSKPKTKSAKRKSAPRIPGIRKVPPLPEPHDFLAAAGYRLNSVEKYGWDAYGIAAMWYDAAIDVELGSAQMIVDTLSQQVCELNAVDNSATKKQQAFRWVNPMYRDAHLAECRERGELHGDEFAWDDVKWVHVTPAKIFARMRQLLKKQTAAAAAASKKKTRRGR